MSVMEDPNMNKGLVELSRDAILDSNDIELTPIEAFGGIVYIKSITAAERERWMKSVKKGESVEVREMRVKLVALALCSSDGANLFTATDIPKLNEKPDLIIQALFDAICECNGLNEDAVDNAEKN